MAKASVQFVCDSCGDSFNKWSGKCASCGEWNTLKEFKLPAGAGGKLSASVSVLEPESISQTVKARPVERLMSGLDPLDTVLGGGMVRGSVLLVAGEPGIGKSTLLMQAAAMLAQKHKVLYVSAEESTEQVALRAQRLGFGDSAVQLASTISADAIASTIAHSNFDLVIVDSIQTVSTDRLQASSGTASQITQSAQMLSRAAKATNTALVLVGHVTKEGSIAGPKLLEHLVDVVLNIEGDRYGGFKVLRGVKNRFGSTNEVGLFEMQESGMVPVNNPSAALLEQRQVSDGSVVMATMEGSRPLLVEVQALVNPTSYGYPKRTASGIELTRLNVLIAVLNRRTKLDLSQHDVFVNIVGGLRIQEPAADLAVCMAIATAAKGMRLKDDAVVFGEVGLSGEVRHVSSTARRAEEAKKLGFERTIGPITKPVIKENGYTPVADLRMALNSYLTKG